MTDAQDEFKNQSHANRPLVTLDDNTWTHFVEMLDRSLAATEAAILDDALRRAVLTLLHTAHNMCVTLRRLTESLGDLDRRLEALESKVDETNQRVRVLEASTSEIKDLLLRALRRGHLAH